MKTGKLLLLAMLPLVTVGCVAVAPDRPEVTHRQYNNYPQVRNDGIDARQREQQKSISAGTRSGELTKKEREKLLAEQRAISREEYAYKSDGYLSQRERAELQREQQEAQRNIYREKHDSQDRD